ncbi:MAG: glycerophosphodiester phosphodiesterase family protein [Solirubrobacteraceae bacterium]
MRRSLLPLLIPLTLLAVPAAATAKNPWLRSPPLNIAHQGGEDEFPSNTLYAFHRALAVGADMLELDIGVTKYGQVVVMHDTTLDRTTNGHGTIASHTLAQVRRLDAAYWFSGGGHAYDHGKPASAYRLRGVATGKRRPPAGFTRADFRVPTLREVLRAFPHTPINIEIKGRTKAEAVSEYLTNADALARTLKGVTRKDIIVVSFKQEAVDRFHELRPNISVAPGIGGSGDYLLGGKSPGPGVVAFQLPITYALNGQNVTVTTADRVARAHRDGYAWQVWFGDDDPDTPATWRKLISWHVDGVMTSRPKAFEKILHP